MILAVTICSLAAPHLVLSDTAPDDSFGSSFLSDNFRNFPGFDGASSLPFDSSSQPLDFSDSEVPSLGDFFTDSSPNTPLEDETFTYPADQLFESSCMTDDSSDSRYFKRDGSDNICVPRIDESLSLKLKFPDFNDIEAQVNWPQFEEANVPTEEIPFIPGISRNDELCPKPRRRLCCTGPTGGGLVQGWSLYLLVNGCRGKIKAPTTSSYINCVWVWCCRLWTLAMHRKVRCLLWGFSGEFNVGLSYFLNLKSICLGDVRADDMKFQNVLIPNYLPAPVGLICQLISENPYGLEAW